MFTEEYVGQQVAKYEQLYDDYDKSNSVAARESLLNSLDEPIAQELEGLLEQEDGFMVAWITFVREIQSLSSDRFDSLKNRIRNIKAADYPQQNIKMMTDDYEEAAKELVSAGQYDHNLTKYMINGFIEAGGTSNEDWKAPLRRVKENIDQALVQLGFHRTKEDENKFMTREKLTYKYICREARTRYKKKVESKEWPPAKTAMDTKGVPGQYKAMLSSIMSKIEDKKKVITCHLCGKPGHIKPNCPLLKTSKSSNDEANKKNNNKSSKNKIKPWRFNGPKDGEAETIVKDGKTYYWCEKCGRWTNTHCTATHKSRKKDGKNSKGKLEANLAIEDFGAWSTECGNNNRVLTWIRLCLLVWIGVGITALTSILTVIQRVMRHIISNIYQEAPSVLSRMIGTIIAITHTVTSLFAVEDLWFLAPLSWLIVAYITIKLSPPKLVDRIKIVKAGRAQLRMTDFMHPKYKQGKMQDYYKSAKKRAKRRRQFISCVDLPMRNVRPKVQYQTRMDSINCVPLRKDRRHCHNQRLQLRKHRMKTKQKYPLFKSKLNRHHHQPTAWSESSKLYYDRHLKAWCLWDPERNVIVHRDRFHHIVNNQFMVLEYAHHNVRSEHSVHECTRSTTSSFESLNRRRRRNMRKRREKQKQILAEADLKRRIDTAKTIINRVCSENTSFDYMARASLRHKPRRYEAFTTALLRPFRQLQDMILTTATKVFETSPSQSSQHVKDDSKFMVIWDTGASVSITNSKKDFGDTYEASTVADMLSGICKGLKVVGKGTVKWNIQDYEGHFRTLELPALYVPTCAVRLISCSSLLQKYSDETIVMTNTNLILSGADKDPRRNSIIAWLNDINNLPTSPAFLPKAQKQVAMALNATMNVVNRENFNLTPTQKFYLEWHQRLGHPSHPRLMFVFRSGILSNTEANRKLVSKVLRDNMPCKCAACIFAKQVRRPTGATTTRRNVQVGSLDTNHHYPGSQVSTDHFNCRVKGRLFDSYGKTPEQHMFSGGVIMVDTATKYVWVKPLVSIDGAETVQAKDEYESHCRDYGVINKEYLTDLGTPFTSADFSDHLSNMQQIVHFAGTAAHHQNGIAERAIRTIMTTARVMMIHAAIHWHEMADTQLWPMAVQYAVYIYNHLPNIQTGVSPQDRFTRTTWAIKHIHDLHTWGCPVYVLHKSLQDGNKLSRWRARSKRCVYMGMSSLHKENVALVLNPESGAITAQYHVVFDDAFSTISTAEQDLPDFNSEEWVKLFGESQFQFMNQIKEIEADELFPYQKIVAPRSEHTRYRDDRVTEAMTRARPPVPVEPEYEQGSRLSLQREQDQQPQAYETPMNISTQQRESPTSRPTSNVQPRSDVERPAPSTPWTTNIDLENKTRATPRKPTKPPSPQIKLPRKYTNQLITENQPKRISRFSTKNEATNSGPLGVRRSSRHSQQTKIYVPEETEYAGKKQNFALLASNSKQKNPDIFTWDEAMRSEFRDQWVEAAQVEITELESRDTWDEVDISEAGDNKVLPGTWTFKMKRAPDGTIKRFKARWCCRGDLQNKEDIGESVYAPVADFATVRLFLIWLLHLKWVSCTMDFTNAFVQAPLSTPVYLHPPRGFRASKTGRRCLKLKKSHYGLPIAPKKWYHHLVDFLMGSLGFIRSNIDQCLLYREDCMLIIYVDDLGVAARTMGIIDDLVGRLQKGGFELTKDSTFEEYLGIQFDKNSDGTVLMSQPGLINKIIMTMGMEMCNPNKTPATKVPLGKDVNGERMSEEWDYRSIVGMLLYVSSNTRPDIAYAVSQVARFTHEPRKSHATALKTIVRYLAGTKDKGIIFKPSNDLKLECYVDADFAGLYGVEDPSDSTSAKSRTGYIIFFGNCPTLWKLQLQTEVSVSTLESEYVALSQSLRTVIPMQTLLNEVAPRIITSTSFTVAMISTVFEDNNGALSLATTHKVTSRTKHFNIKYHFFWENVENGDIVIKRIDTQEQRADILTKRLTKDIFKKIRGLIQGW